VAIREKIGRRARKAGLSLQPSLIESLGSYFELLKRWNQKVSLTALQLMEEGDEAVDRLLIEPLLAAKFIRRAGATLIDVGSGGGSPAIPLKLACPAVALLMVESKTRKAAFLREATRQLGLTNTAVEAHRLEELLIRPELHEVADLVTIRAVRTEKKLLTGVQMLLKPEGVLFLFRSGDATADAALGGEFLALESSHTLLPHLQTRLAVFRNVPRGTFLRR